MYTEEDLDFAIKKNIFTESAVNEFRNSLYSSKGTHLVDEENIQLVGSHNDIFVSFASILLLFSSLFFLLDLPYFSGSLLFFMMTWLLTEFFVLRRRLKLPGVVLSLAFLGISFSLSLNAAELLFDGSVDVLWYFIFSPIFTAIAGYIYWLRFKIPITLALITTIVVCIPLYIFFIIPNASDDLFLAVAFSCGIVIFLFAMYWDSKDTKRLTYKTNVAFWLHVFSTPFIIHSIVIASKIKDESLSLDGMLAIIAMYIFLTIISIIIDRRSLMVTSIGYVIYLIGTILTYENISIPFALTGLLLGIFLLTISIFWHSIRVAIMSKLPSRIKIYLPIAKQEG